MTRRDVDRYELERRFAPHLDPTWAEAVLLELRLLGVRGDRIGSALSEADAFCVDSGQQAAEAFGDPAAYARSLDLPAEADPGARENLGMVAQVGLDVLGVLLLAYAYPAWRSGDRLSVTAGAALAAAVILLGVGVVLWQGDRVLRTVLRGTTSARVALGSAVAAWFTVAVALPAALTGQWWVLPAAPALVVALLALTAGALLGRRGPAPDPVSAPLVDAPAPTSGSAAADAVARRAPVLVGALLVIGLTELVRALG